VGTITTSRRGPTPDDDGALVARPWPDADRAGAGVGATESPAVDGPSLVAGDTSADAGGMLPEAQARRRGRRGCSETVRRRRPRAGTTARPPPMAVRWSTASAIRSDRRHGRTPPGRLPQNLQRRGRLLGVPQRGHGAICVPGGVASRICTTGDRLARARAAGRRVAGHGRGGRRWWWGGGAAVSRSPVNSRNACSSRELQVVRSPNCDRRCEHLDRWLSVATLCRAVRQQDGHGARKARMAPRPQRLPVSWSLIGDAGRAAARSGSERVMRTSRGKSPCRTVRGRTCR
jgi:hypothetical protein